MVFIKGEKKMKLHELKIKKSYLLAIEGGVKTFELRKNDRDYQVGDLIHFNPISDDEPIEVPSNIRFPNMLTRRVTDVYQITYVLKDVPEYGLDKDYCILGIKRLEQE